MSSEMKEYALDVFKLTWVIELGLFVTYQLH